MGSKHPKPTAIITTNPLPIRTIFEIAESYEALLNGRASEAAAFKMWAKDQMHDFHIRLGKEPDLHVRVYTCVSQFTKKTNRCASTAVVVEGVKLAASPTGVRGSLSRLVKAGFLIRPEVGKYWPADVLYERENQ